MFTIVNTSDNICEYYAHICEHLYNKNKNIQFSINKILNLQHNKFVNFIIKK